MASTTITTNAAALSRAADAIIAKDGKITKNGILNAVASAIFGKGTDWGFIKNAPSGTLTQPGLDRPVVAPQVAHIWTLTTEDGDSTSTNIFGSQAAAFEHIAENFDIWENTKHPIQHVFKCLKERGSYHFAEDNDDDDDYYNALHFQLEKHEILPQTFEETPDYTTQEGLNQLFKKKRSKALYLPNAPILMCNDHIPDGLLFRDLDHAEASAQTLNKKMPNWRSQLISLEECDITVTFNPQAWMNDWAVSVDPEGDTDWDILANEIMPYDEHYEELQNSPNAPEWVKNWDGPFLIELMITPKG